MKIEDIENAAEEHADRISHYKTTDLISFANGFVEGAEWRINSVWHDNLKEAQTRKCIMVRFTNGLFNLFEDVRELKEIEDKVESFAYIEDLLPTKEE